MSALNDGPRTRNKAQHPGLTFPFHYAAMEDAFEQAGCPACSVLRRMEERSIFFFLYEGMTDPRERRRFVEGGGFCPRHFRIVAGLKEKFAIGNFEIAALFGSLLQNLLQGIDWSADKPAISFNGTKGAKSAGGVCIFCSETSEREIGLLMAIEQLLEDDDFKQQIGEHPLCWRHSLIAGNSWRDVCKRAWLLENAGNSAAGMSRHLEALLAEQDLDKTVLRATVAKAIKFLAGTPY